MLIIYILYNFFCRVFCVLSTRRRKVLVILDISKRKLVNWTWWRKKRLDSATVWICQICMTFAKAVGWPSVPRTKNVSHRSTTNYDGLNWPSNFCIILILKMLRWVFFSFNFFIIFSCFVLLFYPFFVLIFFLFFFLISVLFNFSWFNGFPLLFFFFRPVLIHFWFFPFDFNDLIYVLQTWIGTNTVRIDAV